MEKIQITKSAVQADIENGFTRKELAVKYGVPQTQVTKLINHLGLKGVRAQKFMFEIVDEPKPIEEVQEADSEVFNEEILNEYEPIEEEAEVHNMEAVEDNERETVFDRIN